MEQHEPGSISTRGCIKHVHTSDPFAPCATIERVKTLVRGKWARVAVAAVRSSGTALESDEFSTVPGGDDHRVIRRGALDFFGNGFNLEGAGLDGPYLDRFAGWIFFVRRPADLQSRAKDTQVIRDPRVLDRRDGIGFTTCRDSITRRRISMCLDHDVTEIDKMV